MILQKRNVFIFSRSVIGVIFLLMFSVLSHSANAQNKKNETPQLTRIEFLFDASQSMYGRWQSGAKIDVAKMLMKQLLDSLRYVNNLEIALRVYGHQKNFPPQDCDDSKLEVPFSKGNISAIQQVLKDVIPRGTTPIAKSLELCGNDFPQSPSRNIIILITDGIEECGGDPCAISQALQKKGIFLKPFVIGLGLDPSLMKTFECVGRYFDATNETMFKDALNIVISQALNNTTLQVNLLDVNRNPTETNVNMTFYDKFTTHASVKEAFSLWNTNTNFLQTDNRTGFRFGGIEWIEYRGASPVAIADDEAYLVPLGVPDFATTFYAPANYMETVGTIGLPYYAKLEMMDFNKGVEGEVQSNPISIVTRPGAVIKLTA